ncbi:hypothetical protein [Glutamicibacter sp. X7]
MVQKIRRRLLIVCSSMAVVVVASGCSPATTDVNELLPTFASESGGSQDKLPEGLDSQTSPEGKPLVSSRFLGGNEEAGVWATLDSEDNICVTISFTGEVGGGSSCRTPEKFAMHGQFGAITSSHGNESRKQGYFLVPEGYVLDKVPNELEKIRDNLYMGDADAVTESLVFRDYESGREIDFPR